MAVIIPPMPIEALTPTLKICYTLASAAGRPATNFVLKIFEYKNFVRAEGCFYGISWFHWVIFQTKLCLKN
jgi:hypothetical protein